MPYNSPAFISSTAATAIVCNYSALPFRRPFCLRYKLANSKLISRERVSKTSGQTPESGVMATEAGNPDLVIGEWYPTSEKSRVAVSSRVFRGLDWKLVGIL